MPEIIATEADRREWKKLIAEINAMAAAEQKSSEGSITVHLPDEFPTLAEIMEQNRKKVQT